MKKFFIMAVAAIAALSSCSSDDAVNNEGQNEKGVTSFTATIAGGTTRATATYYNNEQNCKAAWEAGDKISVDGAVYTAESSGLTTNFTGSGATKGDDNKYHAYFPATLYNGATASLPATMPLEAGKFDMPMYAESETTELSFKNLCGVLAITVPQSEMTSVNSIVVSSDKQMNGVISSITDGKVINFASSSPSDAEKKITLTATSAISIPAEGKTFYVPVPANTHNSLMITISDGTVTKVMTTKAGGVEVARSEIYTIEFKDNRAPWEYALQLGKGTATSIVIETGVTIPTSESATQKKLNAKGNLWEVLEGQTLRIITSAPKIIGHGPFEGVGIFEGYSKVESIAGLENVDFSEVTDMRFMFYDCKALKSLDLSSFNTSNVITMRSMFNGCNALLSLDLSNFDTSKVTEMVAMFSDCYALTSINLSSFNTSKVTSMGNMFNKCYALTSLDLSNFNTSKVTSMKSMFFSCSSLTTSSLKLSNLITSEVTDMSFMFFGCNKLTSLDLSNFNTSKVTSMEQMFKGCSVLTSLDLSSFNTSEVTNMNQMFASCDRLQTLTLSNNFVMTKVSNKEGMFQYCGWSYSPNVNCTVYGVTDSALKNALRNGTYWQFMKFDGE